jgi:hypothetical protein
MAAWTSAQCWRSSLRSGGRTGEILTRKDAYHEVAPQLVLMAWLQRIVNGGGYVEREYGVGRGRTDLLVRKLLPDGDTQISSPLEKQAP